MLVKHFIAIGMVLGVTVRDFFFELGVSGN